MLFRQPLHEPMSAFPVITDVGLTGGMPRYFADELRDIWGITACKADCATTFGGLGLQQIPTTTLTPPGLAIHQL